MRRRLGRIRARADSSWSRLGRLVTRRATLLATAVAWSALTVIVALVVTPAGTAVVVAALGLLILIVMQIYRQLSLLRGDVRAQLQRGRSPGGPAEAELTRAVTEVLDRLKLTALSLGRLSEDLARSKTVLREALATEIDQAVRRLELLQNLRAAAGTSAWLPPMARWGASPELVLRLVEAIRAEQPRLVVNCGGGAATLWCALTIRQLAGGGRVVALEPDQGRARELAELLATHGVADLAEVRHAPLQSHHVDGASVWWCARRSWADLRGIGLLSVANPSAGDQPAGSAPLWLLADRLDEQGMVLLDAAIIETDAGAVERWLAATPTASGEPMPDDGVVMLRCHASGGASSHAAAADA